MQSLDAFFSSFFKILISNEASVSNVGTLYENRKQTFSWLLISEFETPYAVDYVQEGVVWISTIIKTKLPKVADNGCPTSAKGCACFIASWSSKKQLFPMCGRVRNSRHCFPRPIFLLCLFLRAPPYFGSKSTQFEDKRGTAVVWKTALLANDASKDSYLSTTWHTILRFYVKGCELGTI